MLRSPFVTTASVFVGNTSSDRWGSCSGHVQSKRQGWHQVLNQQGKSLLHRSSYLFYLPSLQGHSIGLLQMLLYLLWRHRASYQASSKPFVVRKFAFSLVLLYKCFFHLSWFSKWRMVARIHHSSRVLRKHQQVRLVWSPSFRVLPKEHNESHPVLPRPYRRVFESRSTCSSSRKS